MLSHQRGTRAALGPNRPNTSIKYLAQCARFAFGITALCIALSTLLSKTGPHWLFRLADYPFQWLCHRIPERVISAAGATMPLCSRCAGLWLGMCVGAVLARPLLQPKTLQWLCASGAIFMILEILSQDMHLHSICHPTRLLSGLWIALPFGASLGAVLKHASKEGQLRYPH